MLKVKEELFEYQINTKSNNYKKRLLKETLMDKLDEKYLKLIYKNLEDIITASKLANINNDNQNIVGTKEELDILKSFDNANIDEEVFQSTINNIFNSNTKIGRCNIKKFFFNFSADKYSYILNRTILENENSIFFKCDIVRCSYVENLIRTEVEGVINNISKKFIEINRTIIPIDSIMSIEKIGSKEKLYLLENYEYIKFKNFDMFEELNTHPYTLLGKKLNSYQCNNLTIAIILLIVFSYITFVPKINISIYLKIFIDVICIIISLFCILNAFVKINGYTLLYFLTHKKNNKI